MPAYPPDSPPADAISGGQVQMFLDLKGRPVLYLGSALDEVNDKIRAVQEGYKATYSFALNAYTPQATPTDWLTILGSATKVVRLTRLMIRARATAAAQYRVSLIKYSTAYSAGTPAAATIVAHDSANAAATAVVNTWNGGVPTLGTAIGKIVDESLPVAIVGTPATPDPRVVYDFGTNNEQGVVLRGITQYLALNSAGVALLTGLVFDVRGTFTEE